jgi:hypothetical protein
MFNVIGHVRTGYDCMCRELTVRFHTRTSPSPAPDAQRTSDVGSVASAYTPSLWPSRAYRKGLENI